MSSGAGESAHIIASGVVQGVGYRAFTERRARELGLRGWARNLYDGRVEVLAEGERSAIEALIERLRRGPRSAEVSGLEVTWVGPQGAAEFVVRRDAEGPEHLA